MRGLDPRIHHEEVCPKVRDCRVKPGNDNVSLLLAHSTPIVVRS